jgi:hypothetical protein
MHKASQEEDNKYNALFLDAFFESQVFFRRNYDGKNLDTVSAQEFIDFLNKMMQIHSQTQKHKDVKLGIMHDYLFHWNPTRTT